MDPSLKMRFWLRCERCVAVSRDRDGWEEHSGQRERHVQRSEFTKGTLWLRRQKLHYTQCIKNKNEGG